MNPVYLNIFLLLLINRLSFGQILPAPGARLNYNQIMFEHPKVKGASNYLIEVATDTSGAAFTQPILKSIDSSTAVMLGNFQFGKKYTWKFAGLKDGIEMAWNGPYKFEVLGNEAVDTNLHRVRVLQQDSVLNSGGLILLDEAGVIVDRKGNFVWFLPKDTGVAINEDNGSQPLAQVAGNDLSITRTGTLILIADGRAEEINLAGQVVWKAPQEKTIIGDSVVTFPYRYHHCIKKLENGNYMVLDMEPVKQIQLSAGSKVRGINKNAGLNNNKRNLVNELISEFDARGNLVWSWSSANYFDSVERAQMIKGKPDMRLHNSAPGGHMNAFDIDEKNGFVYAGFRNVSRIIKIDKKTGNVICAWGDNMKYHGLPNADGFFAKQHGTTLLRNGNIAVFNNNVHPQEGASENDSYTIPGVVIFTQPSDSMNSQITWAYNCALDAAKQSHLRGGNVDEFKNGNLLVCTGDVSRVFEITQNKKVVWDGFIEKYNKADSAWQPFPLFRAHYSSSLYPCYFTVTADEDTLIKQKVSFKLRICNDGTEGDSYLIDVSSDEGYFKKHFLSAALQSKKMLELEIVPDRPVLTSDRIEVSVTSKNNPGFRRNIYIQYNK